MTDASFSTRFTVDRTPEAVFAAVTDVAGWWGEVDGTTDVLGGEFTYAHLDMHRSTQRVTELVPGRRVVWHVVEAHLSFTEDPREWEGTDIVFDIEPTASGTELRFTHVGIAPGVECYDMCSSAWSVFVGHSLRQLVLTGTGRPGVPEPVQA